MVVSEFCILNSVIFAVPNEAKAPVRPILMMGPKSGGETLRTHLRSFAWLANPSPNH
jgi:hypothetical protein